MPNTDGIAFTKHEELKGIGKILSSIVFDDNCYMQYLQWQKLVL